MDNIIKIRNAKPEEFVRIGELLIASYSALEGFPKEQDQPEYYKMLRDIGTITERPKTELLVALTGFDEVVGAVVYFRDMQYYGSGGTATQEKNASGFRLLAVDPKHRGEGIGTKLTQFCIDKANEEGKAHLVIHTTDAMKIAWAMYEKLGFRRAADLDFMQQDLPVFGFRLKLIN